MLDSHRIELSGVPEIRQERVAAIRQAILEGTRDISSSDIAEAILSEYGFAEQPGALRY